MEIRFKKGTRIKSQAEDVYAELERVRGIGGGDLSLQLLIEESKPKSAALHQDFTWVTAKAANHWRLHEARKLVQSIEIIRDDMPPTRAYESVRIIEIKPEVAPKAKHVFRTIEDIMRDPDTRDELLAQAFREGAAFRKRFHGLQELAKVFAALDEALLTVKLRA